MPRPPARTSLVPRLAKYFRLGEKPVYLPSHRIIFLRKPKHSPEFATFQVPLTFTKFDIRDYLYNLYDVNVLGVRSQVRLSPLQYRPLGKQVYRPASKKYMTVRLEEPFVWPEVPSNLEPWMNVVWKAREDSWDVMRRESYEKSAGKIPLRSDAVWEEPADELERRRWEFLRRGSKSRRKSEEEEPTRKVSSERKRLAAAAEELRRSKVGWSQGFDLDVKWRKGQAGVAPKSPYARSGAGART